MQTAGKLAEAAEVAKDGQRDTMHNSSYFTQIQYNAVYTVKQSS